MHDIIFSELQKYAEKKLGAGAWKKLVAEAGLGTKTYLVTSSYPDTEAVALITTASRLTNLPVPAILEDFGAFIVPSLLSIYKPLIKKDWKTLELIEHTEETIHKVVRLQNPGAAPPALIVKRLSPREVVITYSSQRKMWRHRQGDRERDRRALPREDRDQRDDVHAPRRSELRHRGETGLSPSG